MSYFKGSEAESLRPDGQWAGVTLEQRNAKIDALIEVIQRCATAAISVRVRQKDYDEIIKSSVPPEWDDAYHYLFPTFLAATLKAETDFGAGQSVEFVFDASQRLDKKSAMQYGQIRDTGGFDGRIANVLFRDEEQFLPLQAADLLAWQTRRFLSVTNEPRRPHFDGSARESEKPAIGGDLSVLPFLGFPVRGVRPSAADLRLANC